MMTQKSLESAIKIATSDETQESKEITASNDPPDKADTIDEDTQENKNQDPACDTSVGDNNDQKASEKAQHVASGEQSRKQTEESKINSVAESDVNANRLQMGNELLEYVRTNKTMEFEKLMDSITQKSSSNENENKNDNESNDSSNNISDLEWILNHFSDPHYGDTLLIKAAYRSNFHLVDLLLQHKVKSFLHCLIFLCCLSENKQKKNVS